MDIAFRSLIESIKLTDLKDATIISLADNDVFQYDLATASWVNRSVLELNNGTQSAPSLAFASEVGNGIYRAGYQILGVSDSLRVNDHLYLSYSRGSISHLGPGITLRKQDVGEGFTDDGDNLGTVTFQGFAGLWKDSAQIKCVQNGGTAGVADLFLSAATDATFNTNQLVISNDGNVYQRNDNSKKFWGAEDDASIYYDTTDLIINPKEVGSGKVEMQGNLQVRPNAALSNISIYGDTAGALPQLYFYLQAAVGMKIGASKSLAQGEFYLGSDVGRQLVISGVSGFNYDHATQSNPTLFIHSVTNPDSANDEWVSLTHDQTNAIINWGSGDLDLIGGNIKLSGTNSVMFNGTDERMFSPTTGEFAIESRGPVKFYTDTNDTDPASNPIFQVRQGDVFGGSPVTLFTVTTEGNFGVGSTGVAEVPQERFVVDGNVALPKAASNGIKVDLTTPTFGFADIIGDQFSKNTGGTRPVLTDYNGVIFSWLFGVGDEAYITYHIPHDYVQGSTIFLHIHWSHIATNVTGGTVTFKATSIYSKSYNQAPFQSTPLVGTFPGTASATRYQQILSEIQYSDSTPTGLEIDTDDLEPDGVIELTLEFDANNMTVGSGSAPDIFIHYVDLHYQSTGLIGTKSRAPDFYA